MIIKITLLIVMVLLAGAKLAVEKDNTGKISPTSITLAGGAIILMAISIVI